MKKLTLLFLVFALAISCSSKEAKKEVNAEAANMAPMTNPDYQYQRALAMVEANPDLTDVQKDKLDDLIHDYANKTYANKEEKSQYRMVLMEEMMKTDEYNVDKISAAKEKLASLNKDSSKGLESFVTDFKGIVGKSAHSHQPELMEVILVE